MSEFRAIGTPYAIAIDGIGDLWIETDNTTVAIYAQGSGIPLASFANPTDAFTGIATYQGLAVIGTNTQILFTLIALRLANEFINVSLSETGFVMAFDTAGNLYSGISTRRFRFTAAGKRRRWLTSGSFPSELQWTARAEESTSQTATITGSWSTIPPASSCKPSIDRMFSSDPMYVASHSGAPGEAGLSPLRLSPDIVPKR